MSARDPIPAGVLSLVPQTFLGGAPRAVTEELLRGGRLHELGAGAPVVPAGGRPGVALVIDGLVRVVLRSAKGRQVTVRYARPGEALGLVSLFGGPLDVQAQAVTAASLWSVPRRRLLELAGRDADLAVAVARECAARVADAVEELALISFGSVRQRIARHLLDLASAEPDRDDLVAAVTQQGLADATGSVREVVARELGALERAGRLTRAARAIVILDAAGLDEEARGADPSRQ